MKLSNTQTYLFNVKDEKQALAVINAIDNTGMWHSSRNIIKSSLTGCVEMDIVIDNSGCICYNPTSEARDKGLWLDVDKFLEEYGEKRQTLSVGDNVYYVKDIEKALSTIEPVRSV